MSKAMDTAQLAVDKLIEQTQKMTGPTVAHAIALAKVEVDAEATKQQNITSLLKLAQMKVEGSDEALDKARVLLGVVKTQ